MSDVLAVAATAGGLMMAASPTLQIRRMLTTRSSADFSVGYMSVLVCGFALWLAYGLSIGNPALVISNTAALTFGLLTITVALRLRQHSSPRPPGGDTASG
jgi:MtN3 and saliva related transmembrane protein